MRGVEAILIGRAIHRLRWQSLARATGSIETDFLNGEIAMLGRLHGVSTPLNARLQQLANRQARERRPPGSIGVDELRRQLLGPA